MKIIDYKDYDIVNYKKPSAFIIFPYCDFKCDRDCGMSVCQNAMLAFEPLKEISIKTIIDEYLNNPLTHAIVCGGREPFDSPEELHNLIRLFRKVSNDDFVIYTGYTFDELSSGRFANLNPTIGIEFWKRIIQYKNIIIKFGRFIPGNTSHYDELLGVNLASENQYSQIFNKI